MNQICFEGVHGDCLFCQLSDFENPVQMFFGILSSVSSIRYLPIPLLYWFSTLLCVLLSVGLALSLSIRGKGYKWD